MMGRRRTVVCLYYPAFCAGMAILQRIIFISYHEQSQGVATIATFHVTPSNGVDGNCRHEHLPAALSGALKNAPAGKHNGLPELPTAALLSLSPPGRGWARLAWTCPCPKKELRFPGQARVQHAGRASTLSWPLASPAAMGTMREVQIHTGGHGWPHHQAGVTYG